MTHDVQVRKTKTYPLEFMVSVDPRERGLRMATPVLFRGGRPRVSSWLLCDITICDSQHHSRADNSALIADLVFTGGMGFECRMNPRRATGQQMSKVVANDKPGTWNNTSSSSLKGNITTWYGVPSRLIVLVSEGAMAGHSNTHAAFIRDSICNVSGRGHDLPCIELGGRSRRSYDEAETLAVLATADPASPPDQ